MARSRPPRAPCRRCARSSARRSTARAPHEETEHADDRRRGVRALVAAWVVGNTEWGEVELPTPLRGEAATNPFYAAQRLVETLGATSERREALGDASSDAVIVLSTWGWDIDHARRAELERWVESGGRLVVDAALISGADAFARWSGIRREREEADPDEDPFQAPEIVDECLPLGEGAGDAGAADAGAGDADASRAPRISPATSTTTPGSRRMCRCCGAWKTTAS